MERESVKSVKGYTPLNTSEQHQIPPPHATQNRRYKLAVSLAVLTTVAICFFIAALTYEVLTDPAESAESIRTICSVTRNPDTCSAQISSLNTDPEPDPISILTLSLRLTDGELRNLTNMSKSLLSNNARGDGALRDCEGLFGDALSQLGKALSRLGELGRAVNEGGIADMRTWVSAATTDVDTCVGGLEEMGSTAADEVKAKVQGVGVYLSNSLAILASFPELLGKFGMHLH